jgi:hypothetical protein
MGLEGKSARGLRGSFPFCWGITYEKKWLFFLSTFSSVEEGLALLRELS